MACTQAAEIPTPPDLSPLVEQYAHPTHLVRPDEVQAIAAAARSLLDVVDAGGTDDYIQDLVDDTADQTDEETVEGEEERRNLVVDLAVRLDRTCRGWDPGPPAPDVDGHVVVTAVVRNNVAQPVIWGAVNQCQLVVTSGGVETRGFLDGIIELYVYGGLSGDTSGRSILVHLDGTVGSDAGRLSGNLDFLIEPGRLATRVPFDDGTFAVVVLGPRDVVVRGANATYTCDLRLQACIRSP